VSVSVNEDGVLLNGGSLWNMGMVRNEIIGGQEKYKIPQGQSPGVSLSPLLATSKKFHERVHVEFSSSNG
jgi:hypothetical protein